MALENIAELLPDYANDLKLNLSNVLRQTELTPQQLWGTAVASAAACANPRAVQAIIDEASKNLSAQALTAAKGAAAIMGMNNIYYRFQHLCSNEKYRTLPARLRMNFIKSHGVDPVDFELWCLAVSAINGCGLCVDSHEKILREKGVGEESILAALRIASVIHGIAQVLIAQGK